MESPTQEDKKVNVGEYEVLITRSLGNQEQIQVRTTVTDPAQFESTRKSLYADFITPRRKEYEQEVIDYQNEMARQSAKVEDEIANAKKGKK